MGVLACSCVLVFLAMLRFPTAVCRLFGSLGGERSLQSAFRIGLPGSRPWRPTLDLEHVKRAVWSFWDVRRSPGRFLDDQR